jgi:hypothetical protein
MMMTSFAPMRTSSSAPGEPRPPPPTRPTVRLRSRSCALPSASRCRASIGSTREARMLGGSSERRVRPTDATCSTGTIAPSIVISATHPFAEITAAANGPSIMAGMVCAHTARVRRSTALKSVGNRGSGCECTQSRPHCLRIAALIPFRSRCASACLRIERLPGLDSVAQKRTERRQGVDLPAPHGSTSTSSTCGLRMCGDGR